MVKGNQQESSSDKILTDASEMNWKVEKRNEIALSAKTLEAQEGRFLDLASKIMIN